MPAHSACLSRTAITMLTPTNFQTGDTTMTRTSLVAMTIITLGVASSAFAQSADDGAYLNRSPRPTIVRMDPLDPVSRVAMLATRTSGDVIAAPAPMPSSIVLLCAARFTGTGGATASDSHRRGAAGRTVALLLRAERHQRRPRGIARGARRLRARHRSKRSEELLQRALRKVFRARTGPATV